MTDLFDHRDKLIARLRKDNARLRAKLKLALEALKALEKKK